MGRESKGYRDGLEYLLSRFENRGFITTREIAELDYGELDPRADKIRYQSAMRATKRRYGINGNGLPIEKLARLRAGY